MVSFFSRWNFFEILVLSKICLCLCQSKCTLERRNKCFQMASNNDQPSGRIEKFSIYFLGCTEVTFCFRIKNVIFYYLFSSISTRGHNRIKSTNQYKFFFFFFFFFLEIMTYHDKAYTVIPQDTKLIRSGGYLVSFRIIKPDLPYKWCNSLKPLKTVV